VLFLDKTNGIRSHIAKAKLGCWNLGKGETKRKRSSATAETARDADVGAHSLSL